MMAKGQKKTSGGRVERKTVEKNRRMHMKGLCFKLASLVSKNGDPAAVTGVPKAHEDLTQLDHLEEATAYIKKLQARIEELALIKEEALGGSTAATSIPHPHQLEQEPMDKEEEDLQETLPLVDVKMLDSVLEVVLACSANSSRSFIIFYDVMAALEQQGSKVDNASFSVVKDKMFCTIHAQVASTAASMEDVAVALTEKLRKLVC